MGLKQGKKGRKRGETDNGEGEEEKRGVEREILPSL